MNDTPLAKLDLAQHALAECKTAMEAKQIADAAEAARPRTTPFRSKSGLLAALAAIMALGFKPTSAEFRNVARVGHRSGKHAGRNRGSFGAPGKAAKAHRELYLRPRAA